MYCVALFFCLLFFFILVRWLFVWQHNLNCWAQWASERASKSAFNPCACVRVCWITRIYASHGFSKLTELCTWQFEFTAAATKTLLFLDFSHFVFLFSITPYRHHSDTFLSRNNGLVKAKCKQVTRLGEKKTQWILNVNLPTIISWFLRVSYELNAWNVECFTYHTIVFVPE